MYLKTNGFLNNHKCENCKHSNICKWCEDMKIKQEDVAKIPVTKELTPIRIHVSCDSFEHIPTRQEGLNWDYK